VGQKKKDQIESTPTGSSRRHRRLPGPGLDLPRPPCARAAVRHNHRPRPAPTPSPAWKATSTSTSSGFGPLIFFCGSSSAGSSAGLQEIVATENAGLRRAARRRRPPGTSATRRAATARRCSTTTVSWPCIGRRRLPWQPRHRAHRTRPRLAEAFRECEEVVCSIRRAVVRTVAWPAYPSGEISVACLRMPALLHWNGIVSTDLASFTLLCLGANPICCSFSGSSFRHVYLIWDHVGRARRRADWLLQR
jgi:hypothetical protein